MSLEGAIKAFNKKAEAATDKEFRARVVALANNASRHSPVDTGRLRANWQIGFGFKPDGVIPWDGGADKEANKIRAASAAAGQIAAAANSGKGARFAYVTNNVPYAMKIEQSQRPLARAIQQVTKNIP